MTRPSPTELAPQAQNTARNDANRAARSAVRIARLSGRFADTALEASFMHAMRFENRRRLAVLSLITLALIAGNGLVDLVSPLWTGTPLTGLLLFRLALLITVGITLTLLYAGTLTPAKIERLALVVGLIWGGTRIWLISHPDPLFPVGNEVVLGPIILLWAGLPLRFWWHLALMLSLSALTIAASMQTPHAIPAGLPSLIVWTALTNAACIGSTQNLRRQLRQGYAQRQTLQHMALHDPLTGIANRRQFETRLADEWARGGRNQLPVCLILLDIDFFKRFNDALGHVAGDHCLRDLAQTLLPCLSRPGDVLARIGGEEFACLLPGTDAAGGRAMADRLVATLQTAAIAHPSSPLGPYLTVSIGIATGLPQGGLTHNDLFALADRLLYEAKDIGRNHIKAAVLVATPAADLAAPRGAVRADPAPSLPSA